MTSEFVHYSLQNNIATIQIDDDKRNALSPQVIREISQAFDQAKRDQAIVILTGREDVFSAGFDLKVMQRGGSEVLGMLRAGYSLPPKVLAHPYPVIAACSGHALAMGVFLMLSADYIIGSRGDFKVSANEVAIGMKMPRVAAAILQNRLNPAAYQRAVTLAEFFNVDAALEAGFFDELVDPAELMQRAELLANDLKQLDNKAHADSKRQIRRALIRKLRLSNPLDIFDAALVGLSRARSK